MVSADGVAAFRVSKVVREEASESEAWRVVEAALGEVESKRRGVGSRGERGEVVLECMVLWYETVSACGRIDVMKRVVGWC